MKRWREKQEAKIEAENSANSIIEFLVLHTFLVIRAEYNSYKSVVAIIVYSLSIFP